MEGKEGWREGKLYSFKGRINLRIVYCGMVAAFTLTKPAMYVDPSACLLIVAC